MAWQVVWQAGAAPAATDPAQVRAALQSGQLAPTAQVSTDGVVSWLLASQALQQQGQDDALAMVIPVRVNPYALIAGYLGLLSLLFFGGPISLIAGAFFAAPKATIPIRLAALAVGLLLGPVPPAAFAYLGHRALRRNPEERGMGRVITGYVAAGLMLVAFVVTAIVASS
ncbi:MAG: hypothetical protein JRI23_35180 [Deltaproteobacteria bacterium]|jgi:hypothetical protein|nr:hypothetical protein [Deltaproteobacteria bacterium]MBW2537557.1 hypothetical protein [Deltaproteobacteria bacterium]